MQKQLRRKIADYLLEADETSYGAEADEIIRLLKSHIMGMANDYPQVESDDYDRGAQRFQTDLLNNLSLDECSCECHNGLREHEPTECACKK